MNVHLNQILNCAKSDTKISLPVPTFKCVCQDCLLVPESVYYTIQ